MGYEGTLFKTREEFWDAIGIGPPPPMPPRGDAEYQAFPHHMKEAWRNWANAERDGVSKLAQQGIEPEQLGYRDAKDQGKAMIAQFGKGGLYATYGANIDPRYKYDWASGTKIDTSTTNQNQQSEPITEDEYEGYRSAQQLKAAGLDTYAGQSRAGMMGRQVAGGHATLDPKTGLYFGSHTGRPEDAHSWTDKYGRPIARPKIYANSPIVGVGGSTGQSGGTMQQGSGMFTPTQMNPEPIVNRYNTRVKRGANTGVSGYGGNVVNNSAPAVQPSAAQNFSAPRSFAASIDPGNSGAFENPADTPIGFQDWVSDKPNQYKPQVSPLIPTAAQTFSSPTGGGYDPHAAFKKRSAGLFSRSQYA